MKGIGEVPFYWIKSQQWDRYFKVLCNFDPHSLLLEVWMSHTSESLKRHLLDVETFSYKVKTNFVGKEKESWLFVPLHFLMSSWCDALKWQSLSRTSAKGIPKFSQLYRQDQPTYSLRTGRHIVKNAVHYLF